MNRPSAETRTAATDPTLRPGVHALPPDDLFEVVQEAVRSMPSWMLLAADRSSRRLQAVHHTRICRFADDIEAWIVPGDQGSQVFCRSMSRIGFWDFGQNARNLRQLLSRVAELAVDRAAHIREAVPARVPPPTSLDSDEDEEIEEEPEIEDEIEIGDEALDVDLDAGEIEDEPEKDAKD